MATFTAYLPAIEEALLEQLVERAQLRPNRIVRLSVRALYLFGAEHGFDELERRLDRETRRLHESEAALADERARS